MIIVVVHLAIVMVQHVLVLMIVEEQDRMMSLLQEYSEVAAEQYFQLEKNDNMLMKSLIIIIIDTNLEWKLVVSDQKCSAEAA